MVFYKIDLHAILLGGIKWHRLKGLCQWTTLSDTEICTIISEDIDSGKCEAATKRAIGFVS